MPKRRGNEWAVLLTLSLGFFMTLLDLTIVNIAIPDMRRGLHASLAQIGWVINAYIIVLAVLMITAGRLGDLRGRRTLFMAGIAVFTVASAASGLSQNVTELIAARAVQGLGAAMLLPQSMAIIIAIFPAGRRGAALGVWGGVAGLATIAGPTVGGMLVTWLGWRWIFFVNIPVGAVALVLASLIIPQVRTGRRQALDLPGVLIASAALVALTYGLVEGQSCNWGPVWSFISIPLILAVGVLMMVIFVLVQALRQDRPPLLPFSLFQDRNYALMSSVSVIISVGLVGMALPLSIYLQTVLGFSPIKAGLTMAPSALVSGFTAPFAGRLADRGGKYLLMTGFTLYAVGLTVILFAAGPAAHWYNLVPGYMIAGLGVGCTMSPMQTIATRNVDPRLAGAASGIMNTARQTGSALGSAVVLAVLQNRLAAHASFIDAMRAAIAVPIVLLLLAAFLCTAIRRGAMIRRGGPAKALAGAAAGAGAGTVGGTMGGTMGGTVGGAAGAAAAGWAPHAAAAPAPEAPAPAAWLQPPAPEPRRLGRPAPSPWLARPTRAPWPSGPEPRPARPPAARPPAEQRPARSPAPQKPVRPAPQEPGRDPATARPRREPWPGRSAPGPWPGPASSRARTTQPPQQHPAAGSSQRLRAGAPKPPTNLAPPKNLAPPTNPAPPKNLAPPTNPAPRRGREAQRGPEPPAQAMPRWRSTPQAPPPGTSPGKRPAEPVAGPQPGPLSPAPTDRPRPPEPPGAPVAESSAPAVTPTAPPASLTPSPAPPTPPPAAPTPPPAPSVAARPDRWRQWLLRPVPGGPGQDEAAREQLLTSYLYPVRDELLNRARFQPGDTVLDVGTGDGLIAFGALDRLGPQGRVIFSDVTQNLLDRCREAVTAEGLLDRCGFLRASAAALAGLPDGSVDVVTTRSVLVYVRDRATALREFHRVLKPGGRAVLAEPVSRLHPDPGWFLGYDVRPVAGVAEKVRAFYTGLRPQATDPTFSFDERDLVRYAEAAGFREIRCQVRVHVLGARAPRPWERFLRSSPDRALPPIGEVLDYVLDAAEAAAFTRHLKPLVESGTGHRRQALAGLAAVRR